MGCGCSDEKKDVGVPTIKMGDGTLKPVKILERKDVPKPVLNRDDNINRQRALAFIRAGIKNFAYAEGLESCPNCRKHIHEVVEKGKEVEHFAELGIAWDEGQESAWTIFSESTKTIFNLWLAGVRRLLKKRKRKQQ